MEEFIQNYNWSITVVAILVLFGLLIAGAYLVAKIGHRNAMMAKEYEKKYAIIRNVISDYKVCEQTYEWIELMFEKLLQCRYKNPEMTQVLHDEFVKKYAEIIEKKQITEIV